MSLLQAAVLGLVQGLTEFLPISSSAHLALLPRLAGWRDQGLAYDVALHWGTLLAVAAYFRADLAAMAAAAFRRKDSPERRLAWGIAWATLPAAAAGLLLEDHVETVFRDPGPIAVALMAFGLLLWASDRWGAKGRSLPALRLRDCLLIGAAQALAIIPGVSRSGVTLTAALALGLTRPDGARFSFLLGVPVILGAGVLKARDLAPSQLDAAFWTGILVSALSGLAAIRLLLSWVRGRGLWVFAVYRLLLGAALLLLA